MIEGLIQGIKYGSAAHRLYFHLRKDGQDALPKGDAYAEFDFGGVCANLNAVIKFHKAGALGNLWRLVTAAAASAGWSMDHAAKVATYSFISGTTTIGDFNNSISGMWALEDEDEIFTLKTAGTPTGTALTGSDAITEEYPLNYLTGGTYVEPTITIYDLAGTALVTAQDLTQIAGTSIWYYDLDASATTSWKKGYGYRAHIQWYDFTDTTLLVEDHVLLDVCAWPWNEPLVTTEEIDEEHPAWKGKKPGDWTDWTVAIEKAHRELFYEIRSMRDNKGELIYPNRLIDRSSLRQVELAWVEREIALAIRVADKEREYYMGKAESAMPTLVIIDADDDLTIDDDEERTTGITLVH